MVDVPNKNSYPHLVAKTMKRQLDTKQDGEIGYTIQQVSRYRLIDIQDAFKPLSADLGEWFKRLAKDGKSPSFAIREMDRIVSYTDAVWPEMKRAIDDCKDQILPMILKLIKSNHEEEAARQVKMLRGLEVDWPELKVISGSLLESEDADEKQRLRQGGIELITDMMRRKAEESSRGIFYVMYHMDDWGLKINDFPGVRALIDEYRDYILRDVLSGLAAPTGGPDPVESTRFMLKRMRKLGIDWPELNAIAKSVAPELISEDDYDRWLEMQQDADDDRVYIDPEDVFWDKLDSRLDSFDKALTYLDDHGVDDRTIDKIISSNAKEIAEWVDDCSDDDHIADLLSVLFQIGSDLRTAPAAATILNNVVTRHKDAIMRHLLTDMQHGRFMSVESNIYVLQNLGAVWPELKIVLGSIEADKNKQGNPIEEARGDNRRDAVMRGFRFGVMKGLDHMYMYGMTINDMPEAAKVLEERKDLLIKKMLNSLVAGDLGFVKDATTLLKAANVKWHEIQTIEKSMDLEIDHLVGTRQVDENDRDEEHDGEDFEYGSAWRANLEHGEHVATLKHDISTESWDLVALDLVDMGMLEVETVLHPSTFKLIQDNKDGILRGILERIKNGKHPDLMEHAVMALNNVGINWPELEIIYRSVTSGKKDGNHGNH